MPSNTIPQTQNREWGFFGTITHHAEPSAAWDMAFRAIAAATGEPSWSVCAFLDSRYGRHFADDCSNGMDDDARKNQAAIDAAVTRWMGWRISASDARETGTPRGLPYLTGYVVHAEIEADTAE